MAVAALLALGWSAPAGPVPGVETYSKKAVDFPTAPSTEVWDIGNEEYLVTFRYKPAAPVTSVSVAGSMNGWNKGDLPMTLGADGIYTVTAKVGSGEHLYKLVVDGEQWLTDPENPNMVPDGYGGNNSALRLGVSALLGTLKAERGDGSIFAKAILHDAGKPTYFDVFGTRDAMIRIRVLKGDTTEARVHLVDQQGSVRDERMVPAGADNHYEFYEYHFHVPKKQRDGDFRPVAYRFSVEDGNLRQPWGEAFPLILDPARMVKTPEWARNAVWYQIMADRFRDGDPANNTENTDFKANNNPPKTAPWNSDWAKAQPWETQDGQTFWNWSIFNRLYGGDFEGVIEKLDYLESLGVTAIYFNPIFEAQGSHKYNGRAYHHADDLYGKAGEYAKSVAKEDILDAKSWDWNASDKKFLELLREAKKRNMRVIIDGVFNHLGDDSTTFLDVKKNGKASRFADWYFVTSWDPFKYEGWAGFGGLPAFRKDDVHGLASKSLRDYIFASTRRWMDPNGDGDPSDGIDGWRLDVPFEVPKPFWVEWCKLVREINPDAYITGEVWDPAEDWLDGTTFDAVMNYPYAKIALRFFANKTNKISATQFDSELARHRLRYPRQMTYALQNLFDSHDTDRWVSMLANPDRNYDGANRIQDGARYDHSRPAEEHYRRLRLMALFKATYVGAPMIWYGTEVGMYGADDPMCRMPMWWDDLGPFENPDYRIDSSLRQWFASLFKLRNKHVALREGDFTTLGTWDAQDCYAYLRSAPEEKTAFAAVLNNSAVEQRLEVRAPLGKSWKRAKKALGDGTATRSADGRTIQVTLPPVSGVVVECGVE